MKLNKKATALGGLAALAVVGGTWAYFNQTTTIHNALSTDDKGYSTITEEHFNPGSEWAPGSEVTKEVGTTNTGDYPVLVRVTMSEDWMRGEGDKKASILDSKIILNKDNIKNNYNKFMLPAQANAEDGKTNGDASVVKKHFQPEGTGKEAWLWSAADGYWYYLDILDPTETTTPLLNSIQLIEDVDMGKVGRTYKYAVVSKVEGEPGQKPDYDAEEWKPLTIADLGDNATEQDWADAAHAALVNALKEDFDADDEDQLAAKLANYDVYTYLDNSVEDGLEGYSNAEYTLDITTEVLQATPEALKTSWPDAPQKIKEKVNGLANSGN